MPRTATGPNGEKLELKDNKWVPVHPPGFVGPDREYKRMFPDLGYTSEEQSRNFGRDVKTAGATLLANLMSIPHASGELLAAGGALPHLMPGGKSFGEALIEGEQQFPAAALLSVPDVSTEEVMAAPTALGRSFANANANARRAHMLWRDPNAAVPPMASISIPENYRNAVREEEQFAAENPIQAAPGRTAGDIISMLALRPGSRVSEMLKLTRANPRANLSDAKGALDSAARTLQRGLGRTAEAGFDGAVMAALGDGDPASAAAWSAGIQAGGSAALAAKNAFFRNPLKSFAALYLGHEMWKSIAPGPQDFFDSKDQAVNEMVAAYGLGAVAALAGATRGAGQGKVRALTDALSSASRATIASVVTQLQEAAANNQPQYARVLELMSQDQERFGTDARVLLERAARSDKPRALLDQIDALMKSERFRRALEQPDSETPAPP